MTRPDVNAINPLITDEGKAWPHTYFLKNVVKRTGFIVGDYTYYHDERYPKDFDKVLAPYLLESSKVKLIIGKFGQIAQGTQFITSGANHQMDGFSTYPFSAFPGDWSDSYKANIPDEGDTVIGDDVWFGHEVIVMPGVTVGTGAIVGARAVVTKDVPPYAVVAGNPARIIRMRFEQTIINRLIAIAWWDWPIDVIETHIKDIVAADISVLESVKESQADFECA